MPNHGDIEVAATATTNTAKAATSTPNESMIDVNLARSDEQSTSTRDRQIVSRQQFRYAACTFLFFCSLSAAGGLILFFIQASAAAYAPPLLPPPPLMPPSSPPRERQWQSYFEKIYLGRVPHVRDPYFVSVLYMDVLEEVGITELRFPNCNPDMVDGDLYKTRVWLENGAPYRFVYHSNRDPLPSSTWIEVTHQGMFDVGKIITYMGPYTGYWMYHTPGSGIWINTGTTIFFNNHFECLTYFNATDMANAFYTAFLLGYQTVQFLYWSDQCSWCRSEYQKRARGLPITDVDTECPHFGRRMNLAVEVVLTEYADWGGVCGPMGAMRAGWNATKPCNCFPSGMHKWKYARCLA